VAGRAASRRQILCRRGRFVFSLVESARHQSPSNPSVPRWVASNADMVGDGVPWERCVLQPRWMSLTAAST
jgi:hypothetical protein